VAFIRRRDVDTARVIDKGVGLNGFDTVDLRLRLSNSC